MGVAENKKVVLGFVEALSSGNIEAANAALTDDVTWWIPGSLPVSGTYRGKKAIFEDLLGQAQALFQPNSVSVQVAREIWWRWNGWPAAKTRRGTLTKTIIT